MSETVRVRFAPSPTGFLHIGGARTALFNWLFARSQGGKFLIRIEDTDRERSRQEYVDDILESLDWLGMTPDEAPVFQSQRFDRHKELADRLLAEKKAYRCDCTPEELDAIRERCQREKLPFRYPGTCRDKAPGDLRERTVVRLRTPDEGETAFEDLIRGSIAFPNKDVDDWVILRGDGSPTYNFVVVVDDFDQGITHILRGDDHINNTPKQIMLYRALGFTPPRFAHLPMILGPDRAKLSKRHGAPSTLEYRKMGYLPEAIVNFLVRLGWSHGDQEVFEPDELQKAFDISGIGRSHAMYNPEKLTWYAGHFMRARAPESLLQYLRRYFADELAFASGVEEPRLLAGIAAIQEKVKTVLELLEQLEVLFGPDPAYDTGTLKAKDRELAPQVLTAVAEALKDSNFSVEDVEQRIHATVNDLGLKFGQVGKTVRFAVTGGRVSPDLNRMLSAMGRERVQRRIGNLLQSLKQENGG